MPISILDDGWETVEISSPNSDKPTVHKVDVYPLARKLREECQAHIKVNGPPEDWTTEMREAWKTRAADILVEVGLPRLSVDAADTLAAELMKRVIDKAKKLNATPAA
jgi:hypothetical protein